MIIEGSLFYTKLDAVACPVNCIPGCMGAGLAYTFSRRWPFLVNEHRKVVREGRLTVGRSYLVGQKIHVSETDSMKEVLFVATKEDWRNPSKIEWIESAMEDLKANYPGISVAFPGLGAGLGGLKFNDVAKIIQKANHPSPIEIYKV